MECFMLTSYFIAILPAHSAHTGGGLLTMHLTPRMVQKQQLEAITAKNILELI